MMPDLLCRILNFIAKKGASSAQSLGVIGNSKLLVEIAVKILISFALKI